jgi:uncharacterized protein (UPF0128 family)
MVESRDVEERTALWRAALRYNGKVREERARYATHSPLHAEAGEAFAACFE